MQNGSGFTSRVPGFELNQAGKTGTSQIPVNGKYTLNVWASFVGFLPANHPRFTMIVVVRKPHAPGSNLRLDAQRRLHHGGSDLAEDRPGHRHRLAHRPEPFIGRAVPLGAAVVTNLSRCGSPSSRSSGRRTAGRLAAPLSATPSRPSTPTRARSCEGGVFFALKGAEMDGHDFVPDAIARGAGAARRRATHGVGARRRPGAGRQTRGTRSTRSRDSPLTACKPLVVGITGSNGKTSTKEMVVRGPRAPLQRAAHLGQPEHRDRRARSPCFASSPSTRRWCSRWACSAPATSRRLVDARAAVDRHHHQHRHRAHRVLRVAGRAGARARASWSRACPNRAWRSSTPTTSTSTAVGHDAAPVITSFGFAERRLSRRGLSARARRRMRRSRSEAPRCASRLEGRHQALNAVAALAAARVRRRAAARSAPRRSSEVAVEHRLQEIKAPAGFIVVDDAYNASPESMLAAFAAVQRPAEDGPAARGARRDARAGRPGRGVAPRRRPARREVVRRRRASSTANGRGSSPRPPAPRSCPTGRGGRCGCRRNARRGRPRAGQGIARRPPRRSRRGADR